MTKWSKAFLFSGALALAACAGDIDTNIIDDVPEDETPEETLSLVATCPTAEGETCPDGTVANGTACDYDGDDAVVVNAAVEDFQTDNRLSSAVVSVVSNETGDPLGPCAVSNSDGEVTIKMQRDEWVGIAVARRNQKDTYQFNLRFPAEATADTEIDYGRFLSVSNVTAMLIPGIIGYEPDPANGIVAGEVRMADGVTAIGSDEDYADADMYVSTAAGVDAFYFGDDGLPTGHDNQDQLNVENSLFVLFDVVEGKHTLNLTIDGVAQDMAANTLVAKPDSVAISNITCTSCEVNDD
jgi:hypothetical protein